MCETHFLLCTTQGNYNNTSLQFLNKLDVQSSNERCGRCGIKLSRFLHPACTMSRNSVTMDYKISSKAPPDPHTWTVAWNSRLLSQKHVMLKVTWKRRENASSLFFFFFLTWMSSSLLCRRGGSGIPQMAFAVKHQPCLTWFSLKAAELTQRKNPAKQKKMLVGDLVLLHSSNTWK